MASQGEPLATGRLRLAVGASTGSWTAETPLRPSRPAPPSTAQHSAPSMETQCKHQPTLRYELSANLLKLTSL